MSGGGDDKVKETPEQKALADIGAQKAERWYTKFRPMESKFSEKVSDKGKIEDTAHREAFLGAKTAEQGYKEGLTKTQTRGRGPGSGSFAMKATTPTSAASEGLSQANAQDVAEDQYVAGQLGLVSMGRGQASDALRGLGDVARISHGDAVRTAQNAQARSSRYADIAGGLAGMGTSAYMNRAPAAPQPASGVQTTPLPPQQDLVMRPINT